jgi:Cu(I)-responsive transcriptional regulator
MSKAVPKRKAQFTRGRAAQGLDAGAARPEGLMTIGQAAAASGVSAKMMRHYEEIGVIPRPHRAGGNYRFYSDADVQTLRLVRRARDLGFSMPQIAKLVSLWRNRSRSSASVRKLALEHIEQLEQKIAHMQDMVRTLHELADHCHGDARPECPILDDLAKPIAPSRAHTA